MRVFFGILIGWFITLLYFKCIKNSTIKKISDNDKEYMKYVETILKREKIAKDRVDKIVENAINEWKKTSEYLEKENHVLQLKAINKRLKQEVGEDE